MLLHGLIDAWRRASHPGLPRASWQAGRLGRQPLILEALRIEHPRSKTGVSWLSGRYDHPPVEETAAQRHHPLHGGRIAMQKLAPWNHLDGLGPPPDP